MSLSFHLAIWTDLNGKWVENAIRIIKIGLENSQGPKKKILESD